MGCRTVMEVSNVPYRDIQTSARLSALIVRPIMARANRC